MKIRSSVTAGTIWLNHNEKLVDGDSSVIEQKKSLVKKLQLSKETIRELSELDLKMVAGGERVNRSANIGYSCTCPTTR